MAETRKLAAILAADVVGFSRLTGADEERTLARLRALRSDLIDPRIVKRTGDGVLIEFRSVVDALRCAIEMQNGMVERNAGLPPERRIEFRVGIHLGDVVEESDGDLMGDGVNIATRLEGIAKPGAICLSEDAYRQVKSRLDLAVSDLGPTELKNIVEPVRVFSLQVGIPAQAKAAAPEPHKLPPPRLSIVVLPFANIGGDLEHEYFVDGVTESLTTDLSRISCSFVIGPNTAFSYKGKHVDLKQIGASCALCIGGQRPALRQPTAGQRAAHRRGDRRFCPFLLGPRQSLHQARGPRHCRMRASVSVRSKRSWRSRTYRCGQGVYSE